MIELDDDDRIVISSIILQILDKSDIESSVEYCYQRAYLKGHMVGVNETLATERKRMLELSSDLSTNLKKMFKSDI